MAALGVRSLDEMIGRADLLAPDEAIEHWKARGVELSKLLVVPELPAGAARRRTEPPPAVLDDALDWELIEAARPALERGETVRFQRRLSNVNRTVGGPLSSEITMRHGPGALPTGAAIAIDFRGSAGQSLAAWPAPGVTVTLYRDAND